MLGCNIWFSAPSFRMGGGLESRCVGRVYGADGAVFTVRFIHNTQIYCVGEKFRVFCVNAVRNSDNDYGRNERTQSL